jgi:hypothetical protein
MSSISHSKDWVMWHDPFNGRFTFATKINMGYHHIKLDADSQGLCTIVFALLKGKYKYRRLAIGIKITWFIMFSKRHVKAYPRFGIC